MKRAMGILIIIFFTAGFHGFGQSYLEEVQACQFLEQGKPDQAIRLLNQKLRRYPNNYDCHLYLGLAYFVKGDAEKAMKALSKVEQETERASASTRGMTSDQSFTDVNRIAGQGGMIFSKGKRGILKYSLGMLFKAQKDYQNAQKHFEQAVKYKYPEVSGRRQLVLTHCFQKDYKKADKELARLRKAEDSGEAMDFLEGYVAYQLKKVDAAIEKFTALSETMLLARRNLATIQYNQGQYQEALDIWLQIIEESPRDADALKNSGRAYFHLGQKEKGQAQFDIIGFKMKVEKYSPKTIPLLLMDLYPDPEFDFMCQAK